MEFKDILNKYLNIINYSSKELSLRTGISESAISRYRNGERTPKEDSEQLKSISSVIKDIINERDISKYKSIDIYKEFVLSIKRKDTFNYESFSHKFNSLIINLKININEMSKYIVFDPSHISRIRYGKTKPSDPISFCKKVSHYIFQKYSNQNKDIVLSALGVSSISDNYDLYQLVFDYLTSSNVLDSDNTVKIFLSKLDSFDLNDYINAIDFDNLEFPTTPFHNPKSKNYFGISEMKKGELEFFRATALSNSDDDIFMYYNMPMIDISSDIEFGKLWMFSVSMCLKKGLHLNIIHNLDRPINEIRMGLETWMPIYMTGQISSYYLNDSKKSINKQLTYVSGDCALSGECIKERRDEGKYYFTTNSKEVSYYKNKASILLNNAYPLLEVYTKDEQEAFNLFLEEDLNLVASRKRILNNLPIFTLSDELLDKILKRNKISSKGIKKIKEYKKYKEQSMITKINNDEFIDVMYKYTSEEEFLNQDFYLPLESIFFEKKIKYTYEEYLEHLKQTINYKHKNYKTVFISYKTFKNITIEIVKDSYVIVSKRTDPMIHFVVKHPKIVQAFEHFVPLVKEK